MKRILLLLGSCFACSCFIFSQEVVSPKLVSVESNGAKTYSTEGFESQNAFEKTANESLERPVRTINEFTLEEVENSIYGVELKLDHLTGSEDFESIEKLKTYLSQLVERKKELTALR